MDDRADPASWSPTAKLPKATYDELTKRTTCSRKAERIPLDIKRTPVSASFGIFDSYVPLPFLPSLFPSFSFLSVAYPTQPQNPHPRRPHRVRRTPPRYHPHRPPRRLDRGARFCIPVWPWERVHGRVRELYSGSEEEVGGSEKRSAALEMKLAFRSIRLGWTFGEVRFEGKGLSESRQESIMCKGRGIRRYVQCD